MMIFSNIKDFFQSTFKGMDDIQKMSQADAVAAQVPSNASYVTLGMVKVIARASDAGTSESLSRDMDYVPDDAAPSAIHEGQVVCYLVLAAPRLLVIRGNRTIFETALDNIAYMHKSGKGGFLLVLKDERGIVVSLHTPVQVPAGATFRTIPTITNNHSGWDTELAAYGIEATMGTDYIGKPLQ